ncbi:MAG: TlpA family protein disulfide reductase [Chloroflexi bacterium]|nr:TlpA family protein disulfide reductase [Chloroflexota bacterium]
MTAPSTRTDPLTDAAQPAPEVGAGSARIIALVVGVAIVSLIGLMVWGIGKRAQGTTGAVPVTTRPAPTFSLPLFEGGDFSLGAQRGKPVLINFWASWCIPCEDEAAALEAASRTYQDRVVFIGVNVQDTDPLARGFLKRFGVSYPNGRDVSGSISVEYGMSGVPETYFVDRSGMLVRKWQGPLDEARIRQFLDPLLR